MKKLLILLGQFALAVFILVLLPVFICIIIFLYFQKRQDKNYQKYIASLGDKNFLCYNEGTLSRTFIEQELIPTLDSSVELIYLEGDTLVSDYDERQLTAMLYPFKENFEFPHLLKLRNGHFTELSVKFDVHHTVQNPSSSGKLLERIYGFFDIEPKKNFLRYNPSLTEALQA